MPQSGQQAPSRLHTVTSQRESSRSTAVTFRYGAGDQVARASIVSGPPFPRPRCHRDHLAPKVSQTLPKGNVTPSASAAPCVRKGRERQFVPIHDGARGEQSLRAAGQPSVPGRNGMPPLYQAANPSTSEMCRLTYRLVSNALSRWYGVQRPPLSGVGRTSQSGSGSARRSCHT